jgi:hypothetical protein
MYLQVETSVFPMEQDLVGVNLLLGDVATIGARSHRPRARNLAGQELRINDTFNVMVAKDEETNNTQQSAALRLVFDGFWLDMHVQYKQFLVKDVALGNWCQGIQRLLALLQGRSLTGQEQVEPAQNNNHQAEEHMMIGAPFDYEGESYTVTKIVDCDSEVEAINDETGELLELDYDLASTAIKT